MNGILPWVPRSKSSVCNEMFFLKSLARDAKMLCLLRITPTDHSPTFFPF